MQEVEREEKTRTRQVRNEDESRAVVITIIVKLLHKNAGIVKKQKGKTYRRTCSEGRAGSGQGLPAGPLFSSWTVASLPVDTELPPDDRSRDIFAQRGSSALPLLELC